MVMVLKVLFLSCFNFNFAHFTLKCSAVTEDANRAIEEKNGSSVGGRKIVVKHAMQRAPLEQRRPKTSQGLKECFTLYYYVILH